MLPEKPFPPPGYDGPGYVKISLAPHEIKRIHGMHDVTLVKEIEGITYEAMVPSHTLGENEAYVPAEYAGHSNGKAVFYLPVGNHGRPVWRVPEECLHQVLLP